MIPTIAEREVITGGEGEVSSFAIDIESQAHVMSILRDRLYTDKILAVLREYSANAWDANREAGKAHQPIYVHVPTDIDPTLIIRDNGPGLSPEGMRKVYTQYGKSTKRASNNAVGMLGIGSKSGFAYASSFTITSVHGGVKSIYNAVLDQSNKGILQLLHSEPCSDETGIEVSISVKRSDVWAFTQKAEQLFRFFEPRPNINIALPEPIKNEEQLKAGILTTDETRWIAVMGCVPYRVDVSQLVGVPGFDCDNYDKFGGVLYFNIGEVDVSASREELEYNDRTKAALVEKFNALVDEYVLHTIKKIEQGTGSVWQKRLDAQGLNHLGLAPEGDLFAKWVNVKEDIVKKYALDFKVWRGSDLARTVNVNPTSRLVIQDEFKRTLSGYYLAEYDYLVKPSEHGKQLDEAQLNAFIADLNIAGIPSVKLSTLPWYPKRQNSYGPRTINPKHRVRTFKLIDQHSYSKPYSDNWDAETEREATDKDIYVVIENFTSPSYAFFTLYQQDRRLAKAFGHEMPAVYGYKQTAKRPAQPVGIEYAEWSKTFRKQLLTTANLAMLRLRERAAPAEYSWYEGYSYTSLNEQRIANLGEQLGKNHVIVQFMTAAYQSKVELRALNISNEILDDLAHIAKANNILDAEEEKKVVKGELEVLHQLYPMFTLRNCALTNLVIGVAKERNLWIDYVKTVDKVK